MFSSSERLLSLLVTGYVWMYDFFCTSVIVCVHLYDFYGQHRFREIGDLSMYASTMADATVHFKRQRGRKSLQPLFAMTRKTHTHTRSHTLTNKFPTHNQQHVWLASDSLHPFPFVSWPDATSVATRRTIDVELALRVPPTCSGLSRIGQFRFVCACGDAAARWCRS